MMKRIYCFVVYLLIALATMAQPNPIATQKIPIYILSNQQTKTQIVTMPFAKASFIDTAGMHTLANKTIISVHYVYTDYPANQSLLSLQNNRIQLLVNTFSFLQNTQIEWRVYRQTNGYSKQTAQNMLHGFVITYREPQGNTELRKKELELIKNVIPPNKPIDLQDGKRRWEKFVIKGIYPNPKEFVPYLEYGDSVIKVATTDLQKKKLLTPKEWQYFNKKDSLYTVLLVPKKITPPNIPILIKDSSIIKYFTQHTPTQPYAIVADVTASMSAYNVQLLTYLNTALQSNLLQGVCFFNDGDNKPNQQKAIGSTGGFYAVASSNAIAIQKAMLQAMQNGGGGDLPENDCEAILYTQQQFPQANSMVLIADNASPVRDTALLPQITKPIHVIISGTGMGVHTNYLNMAFATKGSIFFDDTLISDFSFFKNGKPVLIRGVWYYKNKNNTIEPWY
jgi:hypothetical protein